MIKHYEVVYKMNKLSKPVLLSILFLIIFTSFSCNTTEPPPPPPPTPVAPKTIKLELLDVTFTEAYIKVEALTDTILPAQINLKKDNLLLYTFILANKDTVITDTTLQANTSYSYQAVRVENGTEGDDKSDTLTVNTLTTTSNNFTWQKYTFGEGASSIFNDVAIIDENNIWAVGEIYMNDSTGQPDPNSYCLAHWNGSKWLLQKFLFNLYNYDCSIAGSYYGRAKAIYPFNNEIIFTDGADFVKWDGNTYSHLPCVINLLNGSINKIWGISSEDFYAVGSNGTIVHYSNGTWTKIESGTSIGFVDIWGDTNPLTGKTEIIAGAYNQIPRAESDIIRIKEDNTTEKVDITGLGSSFGAIWFKSGLRYYTVGGGLYEKRFNANAWTNLNQGKSITQYFMDFIRGAGLNDIYVGGAYGEILHFNGSTWQSFMSQTYLGSSGAYWRMALKGNLIVAVGVNQNKAIILIGRHL